MAGTLTVTGLAAGLLSGEKVIGPLTLTGSALIGTILDEPLAVGDNTLAVPEGAAACLIVLPSANTSVLRLRTSTNPADTGVPFGPSGWLVLPIASGVTSLIINTASQVAGIEVSFI